MKVYVQKVSQSPTTPVKTVDYLVSFTEMDNDKPSDSDVQLLSILENKVIDTWFPKSEG